MEVDNEIAKLAEQDIDNALKSLVFEQVLNEEQYKELMKKDRDTKEVAAYLGYLELKRKSDVMDSLSSVSKKVVATVKKELERVKKKAHKNIAIPKASCKTGVIENFAKMDKLQEELNDIFGD